MAPSACPVFPPGFPNWVSEMRFHTSTRHSHRCRQQHLTLGRDVTSPADLPAPHCLPGAHSSKIVLRKGGELHVGGGCHCQRPAIFLTLPLCGIGASSSHSGRHVQRETEAASLMTCHRTGPRSEASLHQTLHIWAPWPVPYQT